MSRRKRAAWRVELDDEMLEIPVVQQTVPASLAPRLAKTGPASVFELADYQTRADAQDTHHLSAPLYHVLREVRRRGEATVRDVAAACGLPYFTATWRMNELVRRGRLQLAVRGRGSVPSRYRTSEAT